MPRRPLFCPTCTDLLDQLTEASSACSSVSPDDPDLTSDAKRERYDELRRRVRDHLESGHFRSRGCDFRSLAPWNDLRR